VSLCQAPPPIKETRQEQGDPSKRLATLAVLAKGDHQTNMRPQVLFVTLGILVLFATPPPGKGERFFFSPPNFQNLLLLARSLGQ